jgi:hypothetical protein
MIGHEAITEEAQGDTGAGPWQQGHEGGVSSVVW